MISDNDVKHNTAVLLVALLAKQRLHCLQDAFLRVYVYLYHPPPSNCRAVPHSSTLIRHKNEITLTGLSTTVVSSPQSQQPSQQPQQPQQQQQQQQLPVKVVRARSSSVSSPAPTQTTRKRTSSGVFQVRFWNLDNNIVKIMIKLESFPLICQLDPAP